MNEKEFIEDLKILEEEYPKWNAPVVTLIALNSNNPFKILISTIISLRTKDEVTTVSSGKLFTIADSPEKISKLSTDQIEKLIYPAGFYKRKSKQIKDICLKLIKEYKSQVPNTLEQLLEFKGVGRKTANLVLALGFQQNAICVDIHVHRISNRLGIVNTKTPEQTEFALMSKINKVYWQKINNLMVAFGQTICRPVSPKCTICPLKFCEFNKKAPNKSEL